ncbi:hypothetical protein L798_03944 [Zootermopsis nevadensis]|uniref:Uncharacterized protein n=1 Tax=Zootermopsis nevadensis TaxID=136037 RepID=A0A067QT94_ZOONE|nr:hypothetical protein L798_03944 [Zootermopsis nevadensis]
MPVSVKATSCLCRTQPLTQLLPASVSPPNGLCRSASAAPRLHRALPYRDRYVQSSSQAQTAFVIDTHQKQSERDRYYKASGGGILKNFKFFKKSRNAGNCPKRAKNQKN